MNNNNNNLEIFKFISPFSNDRLSSFDNNDLKQFLLLLEKYYLEMRNVLGIDKNITFGMELEFIYASFEPINRNLKLINDSWYVKEEIIYDDGGEIATPPLNDSSKNWYDFATACDIAKCYSNYANKCGGHIHIGSQIFEDNSNYWLNFILFWATYEHIAFRFGYGELLTGRHQLLEYAFPVKDILNNAYILHSNKNSFLKDIIKSINYGRNQAINFQNVKTPIINNDKNFEENNTIEFRFFNGTYDSIIWQNNVLFAVKMLEYAKSSRFDLELVCSRNDGLFWKKFDLASYNKIYLRQALELADLIYTNNLDKIYFLRQYFKSFEIGSEYGMLAKPFTRKKINN